MSYMRTTTGQMKPIVGREDMVQNEAGGMGFESDMWTRLTRFLILGSEGGTYYVSEQVLSTQNAANLLVCLAEDGKRTVDQIVDVSVEGRSPKNDVAIWALAVAASHENDETRAYALSRLSEVCRIGTHIFQFVEFSKDLRGQGRGWRRAVQSWYGQWLEGDMVEEEVNEDGDE